MLRVLQHYFSLLHNLLLIKKTGVVAGMLFYYSAQVCRMNKEVRSYILQLIHAVCSAAYQVIQVGINNLQVMLKDLFISTHHTIAFKS
jgi:hypothetical protein